MAKSKWNNSVTLHGMLDLENDTVTEVIEKKNQEPEIYVYPFTSIVKKYDLKEVVITIRETNSLESQ